MKKFLSLLLISLLSIPMADAYWSKAGKETSIFKDGFYVKAKLRDLRKNPGGQNRCGDITFTSGTKTPVTVDYKVFGDGKVVDHGTVTFTSRHRRTFDYGEPFGVVGYEPKIKEYTISMELVSHASPSDGWSKAGITASQNGVSVSVKDLRNNKSGPQAILRFNNDTGNWITVEYKVFADKTEVDSDSHRFGPGVTEIPLEYFGGLFGIDDVIKEAKNLTISIKVPK